MRVALLGTFFGWGGGIDFLRHVANGLLVKRKEQKITLYLLLPVDNKIENLTDIARVAKRSLVRSIQKRRPCLAIPRHAYLESMLDYFEHIRGHIQIVYHDNSSGGMFRCLKKIKADVVLPVNGTLGPDSPIPWVGYLYDFQHKYFPENFSATDCENRDIDFATRLMDAAAVIVNSNAVKKDILKFYPGAHTKIFDLPFSPNPIPEWLESYAVDIKGKYGLPRKYFLISNQFWVHKDHLTAFKALVDLSLDKDVDIICTGTMEDHRKPTYINDMKKFLERENLSERVKLLGHIPKRDQIEIMKQAVAVVQPTLFEGGPGGGCVYDAVSLGVPVILSDIPVNKEVSSKNLRFFKAGDSHDLAVKMQELLQENLIRPTNETLIKSGQENLEKLGDRLLEAVNFVA